MQRGKLIAARGRRGDQIGDISHTAFMVAAFLCYHVRNNRFSGFLANKLLSGLGKMKTVVL